MFDTEKYLTFAAVTIKSAACLDAVSAGPGISHTWQALCESWP